MVETAFDGVIEAVPAAVLVVVLGLGNRIVDVNCRDFQFAVGDHLVQTMHPRGGFLGNAVDMRQHLGVFFVQHAGQVTAVIEDHVGIPGLAILENGLLYAPFIFLLGFPFPGKYRDTGRSYRGGGVVLGGEDVARRPAYLGTQGNQRIDQHPGLDGHVDAAQNFGAGQGLLIPILLAQGHKRRHLALGNIQLPAAPCREIDIGYLVVSEVTQFYSSVHSVVLYSLFQAEARRASARSVRSQGKSASSRPKWP